MRPSLHSILLALTLAACGDNLGGSNADGGGGDSPDADTGPPFDVTEREWTWLPVEGNTCMNDSATGIGLNLDFSSDKLVVFLEGGGACFNPVSCADVAHQGGFDAGDLEAFAGEGGASGILDRADAANPVAGWNYVFIPYCTGDIHAGANPDGVGGRNQVGYGNVTRAVTLVADAYAGQLSRVLLTGQSAGGFGAAYNYDQVAGIFGDVPVDLLDDSGPPLSNTYLTPCFQEMVRTAWNLEETLPDDCDGCVDEDGGGLVNLIDHMATKYPERRFGLISSLRDFTIRQFYGFGYPDCEDFEIPMDGEIFAAAITELRDEILSEYDNARAYTVGGDHHVFTDSALGETEVGEATLAAWITAFLDGSTWENVAP
jgi:hypothetical protein